MEGEKKITAEEVIAKLKDDGDFDTLRLRIIRKLKENEDLRKSIISAVKQSNALNRPGAENLKPRQLSDAIHQEIGSKVMSQISDGVWAVIRSTDGMKSEITETVQSVYNKLVNPKGKEVEDHSSATPNDPQISNKETDGSLATTACDQNPQNESGPTEACGSSPCNNERANDSQAERKELPVEPQASGEPTEEPRGPPDVTQPSNDQLPDIAAASVESVRRVDAGDEDPDVPPGFGRVNLRLSQIFELTQPNWS
ncbi:uncharacterized protein LOC131253672 isoform X2 [Magnolia sinica]|uniref:uncharacterized protein LOC131253672 isoform X2 n=1 Tax=Magnolia sinica TaxID=86752 RepID=UPI00265A1C23|nr:uncharacterized protein LOC131253672 isoform X2 [Magnolia sinica]